MCLQFIKLKTKNSAGLRYAYVPCGNCVDCRRKAQQAWQFRLNSEFHHLQSRGWNVGFCTLTYDEESLPHIPEICYKDGLDRNIPCFSKSQAQAWIKSVRQYFKYHNDFTKGRNIRYFIASEYGEHTRRPHLHAVLAWPSEVSYEQMHAICSHYWTHGTMYPRNYLGDAGANCKSFEITGDASKALNYVSKYVCKDLAYLEDVKDLPLYTNHRDYDEGTDEYAYAKAYEDCLPFHLQSQSLGYQMIAEMTDEEKRDVYVNGLQFVGNEDGVQDIPMYIKNKLVYDNYYVEEEQVSPDGEVTLKRLCRRKASAFFERHRREIFAEKAKFYHKYIEQTTEDYLVQSGVDADLAHKMYEGIAWYRKLALSYFDEDDFARDNMMGQMYLAYHCISFDECYDMDLCEQWMRRYRHPDLARQQVRGVELYDPHVLVSLKNYWEAVDRANAYVGISHIKQREEEARLSAEILDYFNNLDNKRYFNELSERLFHV